MKKEQPEIGKWTTICCCADAYEIKTKEELTEIIEELTDYEEIGTMIFKDKESLIETVCCCEGICKLNVE